MLLTFCIVMSCRETPQHFHVFDQDALSLSLCNANAFSSSWCAGVLLPGFAKKLVAMAEAGGLEQLQRGATGKAWVVRRLASSACAAARSWSFFLRR